MIKTNLSTYTISLSKRYVAETYVCVMNRIYVNFQNYCSAHCHAYWINYIYHNRPSTYILNENMIYFIRIQ